MNCCILYDFLSSLKIGHIQGCSVSIKKGCTIYISFIKVSNCSFFILINLLFTNTPIIFYKMKVLGNTYQQVNSLLDTGKCSCVRWINDP